MCKQLECVEISEIKEKEFKGNRVITFKDIDSVHGRAEGTSRKRFNDNKDKLKENQDYYFVKPKDIQTSEIQTSEINNSGTYLITETGYLMIVKSLTDDLAWEVQRKLVNTYFRIKENQLVEAKEEIKKLNEIAKDLGDTLEKANEKIRQNSEEAKKFYRLPHSEKINFNKRIKSNLGDEWNKKEVEDVKEYVFITMCIEKWEDLPLEDRVKVMDLIDRRCNIIVNQRLNLFNWNKIK